MTAGRITNVRVSVRELVEAVDSTQGTVTSTWAHIRYQRLTLWPLALEDVFKLQRQGMDATWRAQGRALPAIPDQARLVVVDENGNPTLTLKVKKSLPLGRVQKLWLKEAAEVQS